MAEILWTEEAIPMSEAERMGYLYRKLRELDERKKFKKTIDRRQILLEDCIFKKIKEQKNV